MEIKNKESFWSCRINLGFNTMWSGVLLKIAFIFGIIGIVYYCFNKPYTPMPVKLITMVGSIIAWRITIEMFLVLFEIHDKLSSINSTLKEISQDNKSKKIIVEE